MGRYAKKLAEWPFWGLPRSGEKSALDLAAFSVLERQKEGQEAQDSVQQALGKGASAAARADNKTAEEMLQKVGAVAPKALEEDLDKEAVRAAEASGEVDAEEEKSLKRLVHCQCGLSCVETSGSIGTGCECLSCQEGDGAKVGTKAQLLGSANLNQGTHPHTGPVVVGRRPHTGWNLPSISPVFCASSIEAGGSIDKCEATKTAYEAQHVSVGSYYQAA